jgi:hypothetical protein
LIRRAYDESKKWLAEDRTPSGQKAFLGLHRHDAG